MAYKSDLLDIERTSILAQSEREETPLALIIGGETPLGRAERGDTPLGRIMRGLEPLPELKEDERRTDGCD